MFPLRLLQMLPTWRGRLMASVPGRAWTAALCTLILLVACGGSADSQSSSTTSEGTIAAADAGSSVGATSASKGSFKSSGVMQDARRDHVTVVLSDGRVLVAGGLGKGGGFFMSPRLNTATIFDPISGKFTLGPSMSLEREVASAVLLDDGRVLVIGGGSQRREPVKSTELYDPATDTWAAGPRMSETRWIHAAVGLPDGRVLVAGGTNLGHGLVAEAELLEAPEDGFSPAAAMSVGRSRHTATLLQDGRVLVVGGGKGDGPVTCPRSLYHLLC